MRSKRLWFLVKGTALEWFNDNALRLGAALSFYTVFSLAPLLIIVIGITALVFGNDSAKHQILNEIQNLLGGTAAAAIGDLLNKQQRHPVQGIIAALIGFATLLIGASSVVAELQQSMNDIWKVPPSGRSTFIMLIRQRLLSFAMILGLGFLLLVSLVLSAIFSGVASQYPVAVVLETINFLISLAVITVLFAAIFRFMPERYIHWRDVWLGGFVTALLYTIGKTLIGFYLSHSAIISGFGAAGSLVLILLWVYYNSQILFLGAEFTKIYSQRPSHQSKSSASASITEHVPLSPKAEALTRGTGSTGSESRRSTGL